MNAPSWHDIQEYWRQSSFIYNLLATRGQETRLANAVPVYGELVLAETTQRFALVVRFAKATGEHSADLPKQYPYSLRDA